MKTLEVQMDIFTLRRQGFSFRAIAHKLGIHRDTVKKYLQENHPPAERRRKNHKESVLSPFKQTIEDYLHQDNYLDSGTLSLFDLFFRSMIDHAFLPMSCLLSPFC